MRIAPLTANLVKDDEGIWSAHSHEAVSYLEEGNDECFKIEDDSFWFNHRNRCIEALLRRHAPGGMFCDIGGGNGYVAAYLSKQGFPVMLVEPGRAGAANARRRGVATVVCATLGTAGFPSESLPAVGIFDVLEHVEKDGAFLSEIRRTLVPSGMLYITVPAFEWLWSDDDVMAGHFRRYTIRNLSARVREAGFEPVYSSYFFSLLPLPLFAMRSLPSLFGRRSLQRKNYANLHRARKPKLLDVVWERELAMISRGGFIPFGSSCIFAARKI